MNISKGVRKHLLPLKQEKFKTNWISAVVFLRYHLPTRTREGTSH